MLCRFGGRARSKKQIARYYPYYYLSPQHFYHISGTYVTYTSSLIVRYFTPRGNNTLNNGEDTAAWDRWKGSMTLDTRTARRGEPNRWLELGRCLTSHEETKANLAR